MERNAFTWSGWASFLLLSLLFSSITSCSLFTDRTTTVYGQVIDEARNPVDSVEFILWGKFGLTGGAPLARAYTQKDGSYEIVSDIPKKYISVHIERRIDIKRYTTLYKSNSLAYQDRKQILDCCPAATEKKTNFNFMLLLK